jgi:opacity protein-like surface antigen
MRHVAVVACTLFVLTISAGAQVPNGNVYFGYTYYNADLSNSGGNLNGFQATLEGKLLPVLGVVADFTGHYGTMSFPAPPPVQPAGTGGGPYPTVSADAHQYEAMFGPRVSFPAGRFRPFGEFEIGVGHITAITSFSTILASNAGTSFVSAVGGGLDYKVFGPVAWRVEGDYVHTHFFAGENNFRFSTGIAFRF